MNLNEIKHPFLYSSVVLLSVIVIGFTLVAIFGSQNINIYQGVAETICLLWFLIGVGYIIAYH